MSKTAADWDAVYREPGYAFGTAPNDFLAEVAVHIPPGPVLCIGEGEGRNAVHLAALGHPVTAMDYSSVGLAKAQSLAGERGVEITTLVADLENYDPGEAVWAGVVSIFLQIPPELRRQVHRAVAGALRPGGVFVAEAYAVDQAALSSGGPRETRLLYDPERIKSELPGLDWQIARVVERELNQGRRNQGLSAVAQLLGRRPSD
ncbi:MAG: class I SAM-dependent methyltransferase [Chromatiales bacterium]|jgi:SAM-dependent methyltransferase